jgi:hypothetical protein
MNTISLRSHHRKCLDPPYMPKIVEQTIISLASLALACLWHTKADDITTC